MTKQTAFQPAADDPRPEARWSLVYTDTFDRECPPSVEVEGRGLVPGLMELWARFLYETVQGATRIIDGTVEQIASRGFSEFKLMIDGDRLSLDGSFVGAGRLKGWVFAGSDPLRSIVEQADTRMLRQLAEIHAALGLAEAVPVLLDCAEAMDRDQFIAKLDSLRRV